MGRILWNMELRVHIQSHTPSGIGLYYRLINCVPSSLNTPSVDNGSKARTVFPRGGIIDVV